MNIIDLITNIVETISKLLKNSFLINWLSNNILLGNLAILIVIILATNGVKDLVIDTFNIRTYPEGKYGLTKITQDNMAAVCNEEKYYKKEFNDEYNDPKYFEKHTIVYKGVTDKPMREIDTFPAYQWVCQYNVTEHNNSNSKSKSKKDVVNKTSIDEIGLGLETYFCIEKKKGDRAIFLDYEDPESWFCIDDK